MSDVIFSEPIDVSSSPPSTLSAQTGTQFSDITNTFPTAGSQASTPTLAERLQSLFGYQPNPVGDAIGNAGAQVSDFFSNLFKFGNVSQPVDTATPTARISPSLNPNIVIGSAAALGTGITIYATATNPGVQQTTQALIPSLNNITSALKSTAAAGQSVFSSSYGPYIVIGGLLLVGALILKK